MSVGQKRRGDTSPTELRRTDFGDAALRRHDGLKTR
jgi:hypothetical protein